MRLLGTASAFLLLAASTGTSADFISGDMTLRDAIYLYEQEFDDKGSKRLIGRNCDVFQLVLDVTSGYTDLEMREYNLDDPNNAMDVPLPYPDRIYDHAAMFSYALYKDRQEKMFVLLDNVALSSFAKIGKGTVFAYCYSTKADAYVKFLEMDKCSITYSDGTVGEIGLCVPRPVEPSVSTSSGTALEGEAG
ncbi:MAG: hypothetical protein RBU21_24815 [FCB group bacterium]|jgi:hypothetical protein|nr:hypothetical protein [FCB group bacterium]